MYIYLYFKFKIKHKLILVIIHLPMSFLKKKYKKLNFIYKQITCKIDLYYFAIYKIQTLFS